MEKPIILQLTLLTLLAFTMRMTLFILYSLNGNEEKPYIPSEIQYISMQHFKILYTPQ